MVETSFKLLPAEKDYATREARRLKISRSEFIRSCILRYRNGQNRKGVVRPNPPRREES